MKEEDVREILKEIHPSLDNIFIKIERAGIDRNIDRSSKFGKTFGEIYFNIEQALLYVESLIG
jgi:hypothetical protein